MEHVAKTDTLIDIVSGVVGGSVSLPETKLYYVNYRVYTNTWDGKSWKETEEEIYIGPYPGRIAHLIADNITLTGGCYTKDKHIHTSKAIVGLKPRKNSNQGAGPTQQEIEKLLLDKITNYLHTYRRVQEWFSLSYVPSQTTKKKKGK